MLIQRETLNGNEKIRKRVKQEKKKKLQGKDKIIKRGQPEKKGLKKEKKNSTGARQIVNLEEQFTVCREIQSVTVDCYFV